MTLQIRTVTDISSEQLATLIADYLDSLVGEGTSLWETVPRIGEHCLVSAHGDNELTMVSFHPSDPGQALLAGLSSMDQLNTEVAAVLLNDRRLAGLMVLSPTPPPGADSLARCVPMTFRSFKVVEVNGELGLFLEEPLEKASRAGTAVHQGHAEEGKESELNPEEQEFFAEV